MADVREANQQAWWVLRAQSGRKGLLNTLFESILEQLFFIDISCGARLRSSRCSLNLASLRCVEDHRTAGRIRREIGAKLTYTVRSWCLITASVAWS